MESLLLTGHTSASVVWQFKTTADGAGGLDTSVPDGHNQSFKDGRAERMPAKSFLWTAGAVAPNALYVSGWPWDWTWVE